MILLLFMLRGAAGRRPLALRQLPSRDRWFIGVSSVANLMVNLAMFIAFVRIEIGLALLVFYLYPGFVAVASVLWFADRLDALRWSALGLSMAGLVLTLVGSGALGDIDPLGIGLAFMAAMAQAFYVLAARHGFARIPAVESAAITMGGAGLGYVLIALVIGQLVDLGAPLASTAAFVPVALAGVVGAAIPTLCFITGIRLLGAPRAAIVATLEPVVGVVLAAWLLNEQPTLVQVAGGALILVAAVLLQVRAREPMADHEAIGTP